MKKVEFKHDVTFDGAPHGKFMPAFEPQLHVSLCSPLTLHFTSFSLSILSTTISHLSSLILLFPPQFVGTTPMRSSILIPRCSCTHLHICIYSQSTEMKSILTIMYSSLPYIHTHTSQGYTYVRKDPYRAASYNYKARTY